MSYGTGTGLDPHQARMVYEVICDQAEESLPAEAVAAMRGLLELRGDDFTRSVAFMMAAFEQYSSAARRSPLAHTVRYH